MINARNFLTIIFALTFTFSVSAQDSDFDPFKLKAEYFQDGDVKDGLEFSDKENTFRIKNSEYSKGVYIKKDDKWLKHGVFYKTSNGKVTSKTSYNYGEKHGLYESYSTNGKVSLQGSYQNDLREGKWYNYRDDGTLFEEVEYKNGQKEGITINYHANGEKRFVKPYVNDKLHGEQLQYNLKGKLVARSKYEEGRKIGKTEWY